MQEVFGSDGKDLLAELLTNKGEIEDVHDSIAIEVRVGFTEVVGDVQQIQDVDVPIAVDIGGDRLGSYLTEIYFDVQFNPLKLSKRAKVLDRIVSEPESLEIF